MCVWMVIPPQSPGIGGFPYLDAQKGDQPKQRAERLALTGCHWYSARAASGAGHPGGGFELRKIADARSRSCDHTPSVLSAATPMSTREQQVWSEEVARVFAKAPVFEPAVRRALRATLLALADDPSTDEATRADIGAMLSATAPAASSGNKRNVEGST